MNLLPSELREQLPKLYAQEENDEKIVYLKYFFPAADWTWFVTEGEPCDDDFLFFGYVIGFAEEWGYFTLNQLEEIHIHSLTVERDLYFQPAEFSACVKCRERERGGEV